MELHLKGSPTNGATPSRYTSINSLNHKPFLRRSSTVDKDGLCLNLCLGPFFCSNIVDTAHPNFLGLYFTISFSLEWHITGTLKDCHIWLLSGLCNQTNSILPCISNMHCHVCNVLKLELWSCAKNFSWNIKCTDLNNIFLN